MRRARLIMGLCLGVLALPCTAAQNGAPSVSPARAAPVADSLPSDQALRVLGRIPEPLTAEQQTSAPARRPAPPAPSAGRNAVPGGRLVNGTPLAAATPVSAPSASRDSSRTSDSGADVPVPAPTQPVAVPVSSTLIMPDTLPAAPVQTTPTLDAPTVASGTWCVQVAAPEDMAKAESRRDAAQSLLLLPFVIETEKGLHKVRTRDAWTREAADAIRQRAIGSGFEGVFLVDRAAAPVKPAPPKVAPAKTRATSKPSAHRRTRGRTR